ncbi:MAG: glycosyltransferase family 4 protein [bacterium]|nr:glycosyltransferase family 4 protein [bacterium]
MKLLYITDVYPKLSESFIGREIAAVQSLGARIDLYALQRWTEPVAVSGPELPVYYEEDRDRGPGPRLFDHLRRVLRSPLRYARCLRISRQGGGQNLSYRFNRIPALLDLIERLGPDHVHCHFGSAGMLSGWLAHRMLDVSFSVTLHGSDVFVDPEPALAQALADASFAVCASGALRDTLRDKHGVPESRLHVLPCGVDMTTFAPAEQPPTFPPWRLLSVARLHPVKGIGDLVEACVVLRSRGVDFRCDIYGDGDQRDFLDRAIRAHDLEDRVRLHGAAAHDLLPQVYPKHTAFVLPSHTEGMGVVLMEAMACGLPVVATNVGGIPELVEDGVHGRLVEPRSPIALADAIAEVHSSPDDRAALAVRNRARIAESFDLHRGARQLLDLFEGC